ncbi:MAG: hypothetical protein RIS56_1223 [Verrucomicrobiota bacterium]
MQHGGLEQALLKSLRGSETRENRRPVVTAVDDVVDRAGEVQAQSSAPTRQNAETETHLSPNLKWDAAKAGVFND